MKLGSVACPRNGTYSHVVNDSIQLKAYRRGALRWETDRLVLDDLSVDAFNSTSVEVSGDHSPLGEKIRSRLVLELETGKIISGEPFEW